MMADLILFLAGATCAAPFAVLVYRRRRDAIRNARLQPQRAPGRRCNVPAPPLEDWQL